MCGRAVSSVVKAKCAVRVRERGAGMPCVETVGPVSRARPTRVEVPCGTHRNLVAPEVSNASHRAQRREPAHRMVCGRNQQFHNRCHVIVQQVVRSEQVTGSCLNRGL